MAGFCAGWKANKGNAPQSTFFGAKGTWYVVRHEGNPASLLGYVSVELTKSI